MNNLTKKTKKKGFTLVELMAVVAIIAILAVVLVPTVSGYITRSKKVAVITQVRTVVNAIRTTNATATSDDAIDTGDLGKTISSIRTSKINDNDMLGESDISKLGDMTVGQALAINKDADAIKKITLGNNGVFSGYSGTAATTVD